MLSSMTSQSVSTQVIRVVKKGQEAAFEAALRDFFEKAKPIPGQLSVSVVRPLAGATSQEWGILRTFESERHRDEFFSSQLFREFDAHVAQFTEGTYRIQQVSGLETWFTVPGSRSIVPPPRWKMAIVTFIGVYATSNMVSLIIGSYVRGLMPWLASAIGIGGTVVILTWVVMPLLARLLRTWLYPAASDVPR
jgi:antibiotic biosynthesis monooxygenase (ABM) superfamily enzyme